MKRFMFSIAAIVALCGGYVVTDAYDLTPGVLTMRPKSEDPRPYPSVGRLKEPAAATRHADAPMPSQEGLDAALASLTSTEPTAGRVSVLVQDALTGSTLLEHESTVSRAPASNMKIVTAALALDVLGPETTLPTTVLLDGSTLYLVGGGDALLSAGQSDPTSVIGRAGLATLADSTVEKLRSAGATGVDVVVDSYLFAEPTYAPTITEGDHDYVMELHPIAVDEAKNDAGKHDSSPDLLAARQFADLLEERGIRAGSVSRGESSDAAKEIARVESAPVRDLVDHMLTESDNTEAEILAHLAAIKSGYEPTFAGASHATMDYLKREGVPVAGVVVDDNSGLSASDRLTGPALVELLARIYKNPGALAALPSGLPVSSYNGTLANRMDGAAAGRVRAKTGTLVQATSLSGYVETAGGRVLIFSVMADGFPEGTYGVSRSLIDAFMEEIAAL